MKSKAIVLLSGGLDSLLATRLLIDQGIKVLGVTFVTPFFNAKKAEKAAKTLGISLKVIDISAEHFKMLKKPPHGYGKNVNPCIDCHGLMLKKAADIMRKEKYNFVATGEVLGQRPMSQNKQSLAVVEKLSGLEGYLLRPLSAQLLEETIPEQKGLVDRKKLLGLSGKQRKEQMALAKKWKIKEYATPSGGCLLTDPGYAERFKKLQNIFPNFNLHEAELLKCGRLFIEPDFMFIIGRYHEDNLAIKKIADKDDILLEMKDFTGPLTLLHFFRLTKTPIPAKIDPAIKAGRRPIGLRKTALQKAAEKTVRYGGEKIKKVAKVIVKAGEIEITVKPKNSFN